MRKTHPLDTGCKSKEVKATFVDSIITPTEGGYIIEEKKISERPTENQFTYFFKKTNLGWYNSD